MQIVVESSGPELKTYVLIPASRDTGSKEIHMTQVSGKLIQRLATGVGSNSEV